MSFINKFSNWYFSKGALPYWVILALDCLIVVMSGYIARYSTVPGNVFATTFWQYTRGLLVLLLIYIVFFRVKHVYAGILRYSSFVDLQQIAMADLLACAAGLVVIALLQLCHIPAKIIIFPSWMEQLIIMALTVVVMWFVRIVVKTLYDTFRTDASSRRTFIYGIQDGGVSLAKSIRNQNPVLYNLKGFIAPADPKEKAPAALLGVRVYADDDNLLEELLDHKIQVVLVSPLQSEHFRERQDLIAKLIENHIHIMMLPVAQEWDGKSELQHQTLHEVDVEDLLPRDKIEVDLEAIGAMLRNQTVMVTGAAGSIGSEMVRQVAKFGPKHLVLIDQAETPMHDVRLYMAKKHPDVPCETIVSSITNQTKMEAIFAQYKPDYVFHAAAYKHVPMMEDNPAEAVQNNVYGTRVIADLAVKYDAKKFVMISTDKAVNPTNVMGCSKRICEIYCQALNNKLWEETQRTGKPTTQFITTRFGNVLGSNGSVIPIFKEQIAQGGPVTVTHKDIIRFFMLIPEACRLVLQAGTMGHGGEIYVFDMGKPVKIVDLAKRMIALSGAQNIEIQFSGLRDGEKLYEEVLSDKENTKPTTHPKVMVASVREYPYELALKNEQELYDLSFSYDDMAIVKKMKEIVPEFKSRVSKYEVLDK